MAATEELLVRTGDQADVSVRAIAQAVGVTPPSIYRHFASKEELILAVCARRFEAFDASMEAAVAGAADAADGLRRRAHAYVAWAVANPEHYRILFMTHDRAYTRESFADDSIPGVTAFNHLVGAVESAMAEGTIAGADPFLVATTLWSAVHGIASLSIGVAGFPVVGRTELVDHLVGVMLRGLAPDA